MSLCKTRSGFSEKEIVELISAVLAYKDTFCFCKDCERYRKIGWCRISLTFKSYKDAEKIQCSPSY
jgi:hypothetical protein